MNFEGCYLSIQRRDIIHVACLCDMFVYRLSMSRVIRAELRETFEVLSICVLSFQFTAFHVWL